MSWMNLLNILYPVDSIYISFSPLSPAGILGGEWQQIEGRFLYCTNNVDTGGANTVSHIHEVAIGKSPGHMSVFVMDDGELEGTTTQTTTAVGAQFSMNSYTYLNPGTIRYSSTAPTEIENMPAYQGIYAWRRIS